MRVRNHRGIGGGRPGFTLFEISLVIGALAVVALVGAVMLWSGFKVEKSASATLNRLMVRGQLADQFRTDVAQAIAALDRLEKDKAGPHCLILRATDGRHIIYVWDGGFLQRTERNGDRETYHDMGLETGCEGGEFSRSGPAGGIITLTLRLADSRERIHATRSVEIAAALGGDLR
jgi:hypothetical protein